MRNVFLIAVALLTPAIVWAHAGHSDDPIKARRTYFTLIGANMGALGAMAKGKAPYDADLARTHAGNLVHLVNYNPSVHFPKGTSNKDRPGKTRARPTIWLGDGYDPEFLAIGEEFFAAAKQLRRQSNKGLDALRAALSDVGKTCKACHDDYRAKDF